MNDELREHLDRLIGTWRSEGTIIDDGEHHGETWQGHDVYEWFPGGQHLVHRVDIRLFGVRKEAIEYFTPQDDSPLSFDQVSFDADGTVERAAGWFDGGGRYHSEAGGARAVLTVHGTASMSAQWELRRPNGQWSDWMHIDFTRIGAPHIEIRSKDDHTA